MALTDTIVALVGKTFSGTLGGGIPGGTECTITHTSASTYNPDTGVATPTTSSATRKAFVRPYTAQEASVSGGRILSSDLRFVLQHVSGMTQPTVGSTISYNSTTFRIESVEPRSMGSTVLVYVCQGRAA
jgi:hypothetical protein